MPGKGTTRKTVRNCLVCGGETSVAHLGIDLCRACAIFYRRSAKRTPTHCRASTNQCPTGKGLNCKKCRFNWIERLIKKLPSVQFEELSPIEFPTSNPAEVATTSPSSAPNPPPRTTNSPLHIVPPESHTPLMEKLRTQYRSMCHTRLIAEMHARGDAPHPLRMNVDAPPTFPATYTTQQAGNKILLASLLEFGSTVFPEINGLEEREKWELVTEFFYRFRTFEGCFRANALFPEHIYRFLPNFTSYLGPEVYLTFYDSFPANADLEGAIRYIQNSNFNIKEIAKGREIIARLNAHHDEIMAILGLMFWSVEIVGFRQEISAMAERYRNQIMRELHAYYRDVLKLDDYATRLGELLMFIQIFDVKERYKEHFEMLRLLNIFDDDCFIYRLSKE